MADKKSVLFQRTAVNAVPRHAVLGILLAQLRIFEELMFYVKLYS